MPLIITPVCPKTQQGWEPCSPTPPGSQLQRQQRAGTQDAGEDPAHGDTCPSENLEGPNKTQPNERKEHPNHACAHTHTLTFKILTRTGPRATIGGNGGEGTPGTTHKPRSSSLQRPEQLRVGRLESTMASPLRSHQPKMGLLLADRWLRTPSLTLWAPTPEFAPSRRSPPKGVWGMGGISSSATMAATSALPGISVEVDLLGGWARCFGSHLPHPEARQKGFLGKQKETKYHTVSPPWGHTGHISLRPQCQRKLVFL